jgi:hypothetical protein
MLKSAGHGFAQVAATVLTYRPLWLVLGIANVSAGVVIALRPGQSQDLRLVAIWCRDWLVNAVNPYPGTAFTTNYPPYALAMLFPLILVPERLLPLIWAIGNAGLATFVGWIGVRLARTDPSDGREAFIPIGLFLAWESLRIGLGIGQFTLLSLASGLAAVACRGRNARGILLAVAMIKPQVGVAFLLWAILEGSVAAVLISGALMAFGTILFAVRLGQNILDVVGAYGDVLRHQMSGPEFKQGVLELRPLIHDLIGNTRVPDAISLALVAGTFILLVLVCRRMATPGRAMFLLPLTCLWTLISVYHSAYDLVLLWPAAIAMARRQAGPPQNKPAAVGLVTAQVALVVDVPGLLWKLNGRVPFPVDGGIVASIIQHFDRLLVLALFAGFMTAAIRWKPAASAPLALAEHAVPVS